MQNTSLDDRMKLLLLEIRKGKDSFQPADNSNEAQREFDKQVKCLIHMRDIGLIPRGQLHCLGNKARKGPEFISAIVRGLSYAGELAADELDLAPAVETLSYVMSYKGLQTCSRDLERAITSIASDPAQAISSASSTLESVCKEILTRCNQPIPQNQSMIPLITATMRTLKLAPENAAEAEIKRILGSVGNIAAAVGTLRTKYGTAHGRSSEYTSLAPVHARFVVNSMAAASLFLLETAIDRQDSMLSSPNA